MKHIVRFFGGVFAGVAIIAVLAFAAAIGIVVYFGQELPDHRQLAKYEPPVTSRVYASDGRLMAEFATEKRTFVPIDKIPKPVIDAFLSAEDKAFYQHPGVDLASVVRAAITNVENWGSNRRPVGASTITQQVAKNFLLSNELSFERKIKEAILAFRLDRAFSKDRILELYLNQIYLGRGSYGVAAAGLNYYDKSLDELTLDEVAYLAALPKAPSNYDPVDHAQAAHSRRDWVIDRMLEDSVISPQQAAAAKAAPLTTKRRKDTELVVADYFTEEVRRDLMKKYGEQPVYEGGLVVHVTIDSRLQALGQKVLRAGLEDFDRERGWRGAISRLTGLDRDNPASWTEKLAGVPPPGGLDDRQLSVILSLGNGALIGFADGSVGRIAPDELRWARHLGRHPLEATPPPHPIRPLAVGDVVVAERIGTDRYALRQIPLVEGALVALDPHTGRVLALVGGYSYEKSQFNRATQAMRQPGSSFKPFVYLTALEAGYTPSSIVVDAPFSAPRGPGLPAWTPSNYSNRYYGPTTLRVGLELSRNVMTVRLANDVGMKRVVDTAKRLGVVDTMPAHLANALGAGETTLLRLTTAYGMFVNGGKRITPSFIDRIQDRYGHTLYRHDPRTCADCRGVTWDGQAVPQLPDARDFVTDPHSAYQLVSMLTGVVERGTGTKVKALGRPLAGKTGTSNDAKDVWFVGFSPDLVVGVFVGFDEPTSLGSHETGGAVAAPIFRDFMREALAGQPVTPFRIPPGIRLVRVNATNGRLAAPGKDVILEAFKPGSVPTGAEQRNRGSSGPATASGGPMTGTGGLY